MTNIIPFQSPKKQNPTERHAARLTEADLRWLCAATAELRRLRDYCGEDTDIGACLDRAYRAVITTTVEIANIEGL